MSQLAGTCQQRLQTEMQNYEEEQQLELEALESLYSHDGEFTKLSATEFQLNILPYPLKDEVNHVELNLHLKYPCTYPNAAPIYEILQSECVCYKIESVWGWS